MEFLIAKTTVSGEKLKNLIDAEHPCDLLASLPVSLCRKFCIQLFEELHLRLWAKERLQLSLVHRIATGSDYGVLSQTAPSSSQHLLWWHLIFVRPENENFFTSYLRSLEAEVATRVLENLWTLLYEKIPLHGSRGLRNHHPPPPPTNRAKTHFYGH